MKISLENYLRNELDKVESMHSFELATEAVRCWIDEYIEQLRQCNVSRQDESLVISGSAVCLETADFYQEFFNFFSKEHNLILTIQEMDEIRHECRKLEKRLGN